MSESIRNLLFEYCAQYTNFRDKNQSLSDYDFHSAYALRVEGPKEWDFVGAISDVASDIPKVLVVYSDVSVYSEIQKAWKENVVSFVSWHAIYWASNTMQKDTRPFHSIQTQLREASMVIVMDASKMDPNIIDVVKSNCTGCLLLLR